MDQKPSIRLWKTVVHPDDRKKVVQTVSDAAKQKGGLNIEYRVCRQDGSIRWLLSRGKPFHHDDGRVGRYIGTLTDITERKETELTLIESKIRYSYALDASRSGIWEWDVKSNRLSWSDQVWALYGLEVNSVPLNHQLCVDTVHPEDREMASRIIRSAVENESPATVVYRICLPDGTIRRLTSRGMPLLAILRAR